MAWATTAEQEVARQRELARAAPQPWVPPEGGFIAGGCFVTFPRGPTGPGAAGDPAWAGAALVAIPARRLIGTAFVRGAAGAPYEPGLLALREGALLEQAVRDLPRLPDVLVCDATGRDHPRGAGLAIELGAVLDVPTVGVTHRPLTAEGEWPAEDARGATSDLRVDGETVAVWLRVQARRRPVVVHPGWRTDVCAAVAVVLASVRRARTPEPLRQARRIARTARSNV